MLGEDPYQPAQDERWVVVGNQAGGRVFLFLSTDDFWRDDREMVERDVRFVRPLA